jgi:hypothetical protein
MILLTVCWALPGAVLAAEPVGSVTFVTGVADITRPGQGAEPLVKGDDLYVGDIVRTKSNAKVEITFIDESIVRVAQKSRLQITEYMFEREERRSTLSLFRGKIQSLVKKVAGFSFGRARKNRFEIHTPTAVCGVRGTDFFTWFMNGETGTAFKEGQGYIYPANNPALSQNINTNEAGYVVDPDQAPVVKPATDADLEQHLEDTMPTEGEDGGDGGDDPGAGLTMDGGDTGDTGGTGTDGTGGLANDDKVLLDLRDATTVTGITLFSGEAFVDFLADGFLAGAIDDTTNQGPMTLTGLLSGPVGPGDTLIQDPIGGSLTLPDDTEVGAFDGQIAGMGGSWSGLMVSLYAQQPAEPAGSLYDVGYLYGALSSSQDLSTTGTAFSAGGTSYRSSPLGQVSLVPYTDPETLETEPLWQTLAGEIFTSSIAGPGINANMTAGRAIQGYSSAYLKALETTSGRQLGIYSADFTSGTYSNPNGLGQWTSIYGFPGYGGSYVLGSLSATDDAAGTPSSYGHLSLGGNATYMDYGYLGNVNIWSRGTYDTGGTHSLVAAGAVTLDPLAYSGYWGGDSLYANDAGTFGFVAHDYGIMGGRTANELIVYGHFGSAPAFAPNEKYLFNTDIYASHEALELNGVSAGFWKMQDASAYGPNQINYGLINGEAVALFRNPSTDQIGIMASNDIYGRFYPNVVIDESSSYPNIEMFNMVGSWADSWAGINLEDISENGSLYPSLYSHSYMTDVSLTGDFNGSGFITGGLDSGYASYFYGEGGSPGWGIYSLKLGSEADNAAYRPTSDTAWSAKLGGKADFGTGTPGYFLSDATGTWPLEEHAEITGTVLGTYLSEAHVGQLTGPFYGTVLGQGEMVWIGESVGIFEPTQALDYSGTWGLAGTLYDNSSNPGTTSIAGSDAGIIGFVQGSGFSYWAMGDYIDSLGLGDSVPYMQNSEIYATAVNPETTGGIGLLKGYSAGIAQHSGGSSTGQMQSRIELVYFDDTGDMGFASGDMNAAMYPDLELWSGQGNLTRQSMLASVGGVSDPVNLAHDSGSPLFGLSGDFGGTGTITATSGMAADTLYLYDTAAMRSIPFGVYQLSVGSTTTPFTGKPTGESSWRAAVGGKGAMDGYGSGYSLVEVAGTWSGEGIIDGSLSGKYVTPLQIGELSGEFSGLSEPSAASGGWIGQSVGKYAGDRVDYSGNWQNSPSSLYHNDMGHLLSAGDEWGYFGVKEFADHTELLAVGEYDEDDLVSGKSMLWNVSLSGEQLLNMTGADNEWGVGTIADGFTAGLWSRDSETASSGALDGDGWLLVLDNDGSGKILRTDLAGRFFDLPGTSGDGMWFAESDDVSLLYPDVEEQYKTGISGSTAAIRNIGVGAMAGDFAGDGFSGFGGDILPDSQVLFLTHSSKGDLPWGVYSIKLGAGGMFTRRPAGNAAWSGVIAGGEAFFDDGSGDGGMFIASANGTWNDAGEIVGKIGTESAASVGKYMTSYQIGGFSGAGGGIGGDFTGINSSEGTWIGQSVGSFSGSLLALSGKFEGQLWDVGGSGGFSQSWSHVDGLLGTTADPSETSNAALYMLGHSIANTPIMSVAADLHADSSGRQYFSLFDFYSDSLNLNGYGVGLYADSAGNVGYTTFSALSGTHYGKVPVFDAEGRIALEAPLYTASTSGLITNTVMDDNVSLLAGSHQFEGGIRAETYTLSEVQPGLHRTIGFGGDYSGESYTDMYWAMTAIGRYQEGDGPDYLGPGSHAELYYLAVQENEFGEDTGILGRLGGELEGSPYSNLTLSGTPVETDLLGWIYWGEDYGGYGGSLHYYDPVEVGYDTGIFGGYDEGGHLKYLAMGDFEVDSAYSVVSGKELVWSTSLIDMEYDGQTMIPVGAYGFTGGVWSGGAMDGKAFMVIDRVDEGLGYGILLADILGNYYELETNPTNGYHIGGWLAEGDTTWIQMYGNDAEISDFLAYDQPEPLKGSGESYPGVALAVSLADVTGTSFQDEPWGVWGSYLTGTQEASADFSNWQLSLTEDTGDVISSSRMWVEVSGGRKTGEDRILEGRAAGAWVELEDAMTGILGGPVKGTFDPTNLKWQAVAGGAFMDTQKFLSMVQNNPVALDQLLIPRFEVGRTNLGGTNGNMIVNINDMMFFAHSTGASPTIWATEDVSGSYTNLPVNLENVQMNGAGFPSVNFTVHNFTETVTGSNTGNWGALINGSGTVPGTIHNVQINGGAAGDFALGAFGGTGAGVAKPAGE